jgi:hypothetical protein
MSRNINETPNAKKADLWPIKRNEIRGQRPSAEYFILFFQISIVNKPHAKIGMPVPPSFNVLLDDLIWDHSDPVKKIHNCHGR